MMDLESIKGINALKLNVGDKALYRGAFGVTFPVPCEIIGIGEKNGRVVYDNDLGRWGYADQYDVGPDHDPDVGIDRPVDCHNLDRAPLQRLSHPCQSDHDYYRPGDPAGSVRIIYTLEDGRFLVATPDEYGIERYYIADTKSHLVLVEDVTNQFVAEARNRANGALSDVADC